MYVTIYFFFLGRPLGLVPVGFFLVAAPSLALVLFTNFFRNFLYSSGSHFAIVLAKSSSVTRSHRLLLKSLSKSPFWTRNWCLPKILPFSDSDST